MKHLSISFKAIIVASLACAAGLATAAGSTNLAVSASVNGVCKFSATTQPLAFGPIDPSLTTDKIATASVLYKCTNKTTSLGITGTAGAHTMTTGATAPDTLAYTLAIAGDTSQGLGFGTGKDLTATVTGTITAAQYQNAAVGSYTDNVTLNITP